MSMSDNDTDGDLNSKLNAAGRPTVRDNRKEVTEADIAEYACPFCAFTASTERVVRAHITTEGGANHKDRNGFLDTIVVHALNEDGEILEDVKTEFDREEREGEVTTQMLPDGVTEKQRMILEVAIQNPGLTRSAIQERVRERHDYEPSHGYVSKTVRQYLSTPEEEAEPSQANNPTPARKKDYDDLTEVQQSIVDYAVTQDDPLDPAEWGLSQTAVAEEAGCHMTNVRNVLEKYGTLIQHRKARLEASSELNGTSVSEQIQSGSEPEQEEPSAETESRPETTGPKTVQVEVEKMRSFAQRIDTQMEAAEAQHEASPRDSPMRAHADGKAEVLEQVEAFLTDIAADNGGEN